MKKKKKEKEIPDYAIKEVGKNIYHIIAKKQVDKKSGKREDQTFHGTRKQAETRWYELLDEVEGVLSETSSTTDTNVTETTLSDLINFYRSEQKKTERGRELIREGKQYPTRETEVKLRRIEKDIGHATVDDFPVLFENFIQILEALPTRYGTPRSIGDINRHKSNLLAVVNLAVRKNKILTQPVFECLIKQKETPRNRYLTDHERDRLLKVIDEQYAYLAPLVRYNLGIPSRKGEMLKLKREHVDLDSGLLVLPKTITKNRIETQKPIIGDVLEHFQTIPVDCEWAFHRDGKQIKSFDSAWRAALKKAGIKDFHFHDLRRRATTDLAREGLPDRALMHVAGWKTPIMIDRYLNTEGLNAAEEAKRLVENRKRTKEGKEED